MKLNKDYKKFTKSLLKYAYKNQPYFTEQQIPEIFKGWTILEFNKIYLGIGRGCCTYLGPKPGYQINVAYCDSIASKFKESRKTTIRIVLVIIGILIGIYFNLSKSNNNEQNPKGQGSKILHHEKSSDK